MAKCQWVAMIDQSPTDYGFYWVTRNGETDLALWSDYDTVYSGHWENAYTAGDAEGLHTEYYDDVTHWAEIEFPEPAHSLVVDG